MKAIALQAIHQPNGLILGHEVLIRKCVGGSWVGPGSFMAGCGSKAWVDLDHTVAGLLVERTQNLKGRGVSFVNLSSHTLADSTELRAVCQTLAKVAHAGVEVCVEVSEGFASDGCVFERTMDLIKDQGLLLAVDDFGKDWSNFSRLRSYAWNYCKIDLPAVWDSENLDWLIEARDYCAINSIGLILEKLESTQLLGGLLKPLSAASVQGFALSMPFILQSESFAEVATA
jgi:EAL domain-containing protein (putative c-di-GMP-specific phosphodiesterase class I)